MRYSTSVINLFSIHFIVKCAQRYSYLVNGQPLEALFCYFYKVKKLWFLFFGLVLLACEDTEFNSPAFEGLLNQEFWEAAEVFAVSNSDGSVTIDATRSSEVVSIRFPRNVGDYEFGSIAAAVAQYTEGNASVFSTTNENGAGQITVEGITAEYVTGTFSFLAIQSDTGKEVFMQQGTFFQIPVIDLNEVQ